MERVQVPIPGGRRLTAHWVVPGLLSEGRRVAAALEEDGPHVVALTTSPDEAKGLAAFLEGPPAGDDEDDGWTEDPYAVHLSRFGAVSHPPPAYLQAVAFAVDHDVPVVGVDLDEDTYDDHFTDRVSTWQWWQYGRRMRKLEKRPPKADDAATFSLTWDARLRETSRGIRHVEGHREAAIAAAVTGLAQEGHVVLVADVVLRPGLERLLLAHGNRTQG